MDRVIRKAASLSNRGIANTKTAEFSNALLNAIRPGSSPAWNFLLVLTRELKKLVENYGDPVLHKHLRSPKAKCQIQRWKEPVTRLTYDKSSAFACRSLLLAHEVRAAAGVLRGW
jgi:hypothetical protein